MRFWTGDNITQLKENHIFVFGSNPSGFHGAGAAKAAMEFGAKKFIGRGLQGQTYALVTKNLKAGFFEKSTGIKYEKEGFQSVSLDQISKNIDELYECAKQNSDKIFIVVYKNDTYPNGTPKKSLNGYTGEEIFKTFTENKEVPKNMVFHDSFKALAKLQIEAKNKANNNESEQEIKKEYTFFFRSTSTFSQWHPSKFVYKDITFSSAEQFMMYSKAMLFGSHDIAQKIINFNDTPLIKDFLDGKLSNIDIVKNKNTLDQWNTIQKEIKKCGRDVKNYVEDTWLSKRESIVSVASREKYNQNPDYKKELLSKSGTLMVEASPFDKIWGIGLNEYDAKKVSENEWPGLNLLGKVLTNLCESYTLTQKNKSKMKP